MLPNRGSNKQKQQKNKPMDEQNTHPYSQETANLVPAGDLDAPDTDIMPVSKLGMPQVTYPLESIEVREENALSSQVSGPDPIVYRTSFSKRKAVIVSSLAALAVTLITGMSILLLSHASKSRCTIANKYTTCCKRCCARSTLINW